MKTTTVYVPESYTKKLENAHGVVFFKDTAPFAAIAYTLRKGNPSGKKWHFSFPNLDRLTRHTNAFLDGLEASAKAKVDRRVAAKNEARSLAEAVYVGQIFYSSWGWEQTNIDFYEVIAKKNLRITVRKIESTIRPGEGSSMSGYASPVPGEYTEEPMDKIVTQSGFRLTSFSSASPWDGREKYTSWYA